MESNVENSKSTADGMAVEATSPWPNSQQKGSSGVDDVKGLVTPSHSKDNYEGWGQLLPRAMGPSLLQQRPSAGEASNVPVPQSGTRDRAMQLQDASAAGKHLASQTGDLAVPAKLQHGGNNVSCKGVDVDCGDIVGKGRSGEHVGRRLFIESINPQQFSVDAAIGEPQAEGQHCGVNSACPSIPSSCFHPMDASFPSAPPLYPRIAKNLNPSNSSSALPASIDDHLDTWVCAKSTQISGKAASKGSVSDQVCAYLNSSHADMRAQELTQSLERACHGTHNLARRLCQLPGNLVPGSPRHQSAILGARLAWGAASTPMDRALPLNVAPPELFSGSPSFGNGRGTGSYPDIRMCSQPVSPSSFDSKEGLKESLNNGRDQHMLLGCSELGSYENEGRGGTFLGQHTCAGQLSAHTPPQARWKSTGSAEHLAQGLPTNVKYLDATGHMNPPGSPCVHDLQLVYQGANTSKGHLQRLGRQFVMAGRQIARNFWFLVAIVAMAAGTMGFEDHRRGPGVKVRSKRRDWYRGDHVFEVTNQKHSAVGNYSAASFMG